MIKNNPVLIQEMIKNNPVFIQEMIKNNPVFIQEMIKNTVIITIKFNYGGISKAKRHCSPTHT